jgi:hypothetical protein
VVRQKQPLRPRMVAFPGRRTGPAVADSVSPQGDASGMKPGQARRSLVVIIGVGGARWRLTMTAGTLTPSKPEWSGEVQRAGISRAKADSNAVVARRALVAFFGGLSISQIRPPTQRFG